MPLTESTKTNLRRKSQYVDKVQIHQGVPLFSWLDLSLTELCNRSAGHPNACTFCPRIDRKFYPNQNLHMSMDLVSRIGHQLAGLQYRGAVVLCGYGEPLLHPNVLGVVSVLKRLAQCRIEMVTNGDYLSAERIIALTDAGLDYFVVSMYDGEHQVERFTKMFHTASVGSERWLLRDRWHPEEDLFGLKLTNRAGTVTVGPQDPVDPKRPCHYLTYQMTVDWNGDVLLCPQDWHKRLKFGNASADDLFDIWTSKRLHARRTRLIEGHRSEHPCSSCNTDGTLHGFNHVAEWTREKRKCLSEVLQSTSPAISAAP